MAHEFKLPDIGEGLTEALVVTWYVEVGEAVGLDEPLVEVETDKAIVDIPAPVAGVLLYHGAAAGETLAVDAVLAVVGEAGESWESAGQAVPEQPPSAPIVGSLTEAPVLSSDDVLALPQVRALAAELGVDLGSLAGSGRGGRITEEDVRQAARGDDPSHERVAMSPLRKAIAANLARSWTEIPHVTIYDVAGAAPLLQRRRELGRLPLEAHLIAAITPLLAEHREFNAAVDGEHILYKQSYHIGFAVDTPSGLVVAVIRDADKMALAELGEHVTRLSAAARERTATADELRGQTFTISNIGAVGGRYGTPIIPYGTSAILSVGRAEPEAVVSAGEVVVATRFPLSLSYDHRIIDGAAGRAFLADVGTAIESAGCSR